MRSWRQLVATAVVVVAISSGCSHVLMHWLGLVSRPLHPYRFGSTQQPPSGLVIGSSLVVFGIEWEKVAGELHQCIEERTAPAASPCELEVLQQQAPQVNVTFVGVSAFDLNEYFLGDFRSEMVPLRRTVSDLRHSGADWSFTKRVVSQYGLKYVRVIFPTAGRSVGVMVGLREKSRMLLQRQGGPSSEALTMDAGQDPRTRERISDWPAARTLRNLAQLRGSCQGRQAFIGPKQLALERIVKKGCGTGSVVVVVLPVSPPYAKEFLTPEVAANFEQALAEMHRRVPEAQFVRLDQLPELRSNDYFWDLVHLNAAGQKIATAALLAGVRTSTVSK